MARYSKTKKSGRLSRKYNNKKYNNKMTGGGGKKGATKSKSPSVRNRDANRATNRAANRVAMPVEGNDLNIFEGLRAQPRLIHNNPIIINENANDLAAERNVNLVPTNRYQNLNSLDNRFRDLPRDSFTPFVDNRSIKR